LQSLTTLQLEISCQFDNTQRQKDTVNRKEQGIVDCGSEVWRWKVRQTRRMSVVFGFGNNRSGQLGCAFTDDTSCQPILLDNLSQVPIQRITSSQHQTEMISSDGTLLNCGENENNELGRGGKKSLLGRVDALEAFSVLDVAAG
jgi:alpha-tubulin suppressor-like RCC1 family protein